MGPDGPNIWDFCTEPLFHCTICLFHETHLLLRHLDMRTLAGSYEVLDWFIVSVLGFCEHSKLEFVEGLPHLKTEVSRELVHIKKKKKKLYRRFMSGSSCSPLSFSGSSFLPSH